MPDARTLSASKYLSLTSEHTIAQAFWVLTFALLTAIGAQIEIPHSPVPYTLQTFIVLTSGAFLGRRSGFISMMVYLGLGLAGLPVFSGAGFGLARLTGLTGGYLVGFPIGSFVIGHMLSHRSEYWWILASMTVGLLIIFSFGTVQLNLLYYHNWSASLQAGFLIFSWWDAVKLIAAASISYQYLRKIKNYPN